MVPFFLLFMVYFTTNENVWIKGWRVAKLIEIIQ